MDINTLRELIAKPEWAEVEVKAAKTRYPKEALSTVSAFANSGGGYLIFGVDERLENPIAGVTKFDEVQNSFIGILKDTNKFSSAISFTPDMVTVDDKHLLVFHIHEAGRHQKPIYLNGDMKQTYLRKGGRDDKASDEEIKRIVRDNDLRSVDERLLDIDAETFFDMNTVKWYRHIYERQNAERHQSLYPLEFLEQLALVREQDEQLKPTLAAALMFGNEKTMSYLLPRFTLDAFWHHVEMTESSERRWDDRRSYECNLFDTWRQLSERFMYFSEQPFQIDETNLQRSNETPDYIGFREAAVNALVHQDYSDTQRTATIHFYKDASVYFNPGDSLIDTEQLGKGSSAARNPLVMQTFHRIKLSDRAGSGLKDIYQNWQKLDRPRPEVVNDKARKTFQITLGKKVEVTALQEAIHERIGVQLTDIQARVFVYCLTKPKTVEQIATEIKLSASEVYPIIDHLARQSLLETSPEGYSAPEYFTSAIKDLIASLPLMEEKSDQVSEKVTKLESKSDQASEKVTKLASESDQAELVAAGLKKQQIALIKLLDQPMMMADLVTKLEVSHRTHFRKNHLSPLIKLGVVAQTYPETPNHKMQAYYLTDLGLLVKTQLVEASSD